MFRKYLAGARSFPFQKAALFALHESRLYRRRGRDAKTFVEIPRSIHIGNTDHYNLKLHIDRFDSRHRVCTLAWLNTGHR
jgi:hypothetical protein